VRERLLDGEKRRGREEEKGRRGEFLLTLTFIL